MLETTQPCPLCASSNFLYSRDSKRDYRHCRACDLVFVPKPFLPSEETEKMEYDLHENGPFQTGYRQFLDTIVQALTPYLRAGAEGLDFGSGPGPTLHLMLEEKGFPMQIYDPFYANRTEVLKHRYDFITCTEVVEHFHRPQETWKLLSSLAKPEGYLGIMTLFWDSAKQNEFAEWWYKRSQSHVCFYTKKTLHWIAVHFNMQLISHDDRAAIFKKL